MYVVRILFLDCSNCWNWNGFVAYKNTIFGMKATIIGLWLASTFVNFGEFQQKSTIALED